MTALGAYWIDIDSATTIEDVDTSASQDKFTSMMPDDSQLASGGVLWVRLDIALTDVTSARHLQIPLPGLGSAAFYYRDAQGLWTEQKAGDRIAMDLWPQAGRYPVFALSNDTQLTRYYVQIVLGRIPFVIPLKIVSQAYMSEQHEREQFFLGAYFGLILLVALLAGINAVAYRDRAFAVYTIYVIFLAATVAAWSGIGAQYFWRNQQGVSSATLFFLPLLVSACVLWFARVVLTPKQYAPVLDQCLLSLIGLLLLIGLVDVLWPIRSGFAITQVLVLTGVALLLSTVAQAAKNGNRHVRWFGLGFLPVLLVTVLLVASSFNWLRLGVMYEVIIMLSSVWAVPVLFLGLNRRLAYRKESEVRARAALQTDPLTGLSRERVFLVRLERSLVRAKRYQQPFGLMVVSLSNYTALQREFGRNAAEQALVLTASRLQDVVRDVDTAARVGEHEFALLIEGPCSAEDLQQIATRTLAQSLRPSSLLGVGAGLKFHISMATVPQGDLDEKELLGYLLSDVALITPEDRKTIRHCAF
ncbi:MAG: 7TM diverse intracellular signaling domain-containing protein [Burkholderiaceae bacterium]